MAIPVVNNIQSSASAGNHETISAYDTNQGADRVLVVFVGKEISSGGSPASNLVPDTITFDGDNLTKSGAEVTIGTGTKLGTSIWYLLNPTAKTGDIVATWPTLLDDDREVMVAFTLTGAANQAPTDTNTNSSTSSPISTNITPSNNNSIVIDAVMSGTYSNDITVSGSGDQTEIASQQTFTAPGGRIEVGNIAVVTAAEQTMEWSQTGLIRWGHVIAVFKEAEVGGAVIMNQFQAGNLGADLYNGALM